MTLTPKVFVVDAVGRPLLPTHPARARKLLNTDRACVAQVIPFTIKLKKENLINSGKKNHSSAVANLNIKELEELVKKIVKSELKNLQLQEESPKPKSEKAKTFDKRKSGVSMDLLTKTELLSLSKKNNLGLNSKNTKAEIIRELKQNKIEAP